MSAAVMSTSAVYDFGDTLLKSHNGSSAVRHQQHVRWGDFHQRGEREGLSRRASNPAAPLSTLAPMASMAPLAPLPALNTLVIQLDSQQQQPQQQPPQSPAQPAHRKLDRSHSEPANPVCSKASAAGAAAAATSAVNTSRYKTELCRPFEESGSCKYGDKCQFAHGAHELRTLVRHPKYKTELCRTYHTIGLCPYGPRCHFVHNDEESLAHPGMPGPGQHAKPAVPAHAAHAATALPRPKALSLATPLAAPHSPAHSYLGGSTADSPSPTSSLSQSPTNSHRSFFMSSEDVFGSVSPTPTANTAFSFGQDFATLVQPSGPGVAGHHIPCGSTGSVGSVGSASSRDSPSPPGSPFRLPIFNTLSNTLCNQVKMIHL